jgi:hypothetical protein
LVLLVRRVVRVRFCWCGDIDKSFMIKYLRNSDVEVEQRVKKTSIHETMRLT